VESPDRTTARHAAWTLLRDLIHERAGIYFDANNLDLMMNKISDLMAERGVDSPIDYYYLLKYEGETTGEWPNLLNAVSVRETYFWREFDQIRALVDVVVPHAAKSLNEPLRIWSAACASGEEPYSIAIALDQAGWFERIPIEIYASDMSPAAICAVQRGVYKERSFRNLPPELRDRYFREVSKQMWEVVPAIRRRVSPRRANLMERADIQDLARARVVFCRNVFIYFSEGIIRKVVKTFEECMPTPGYLFLGAAESLLKFTTRFRLQEMSRAFVYIKD
jgi:chemotaxis protein methyltransferase CheR